jgi:hypothetical protein
MVTYREYAQNVQKRTDEQIEEQVEGLFGADCEMDKIIEETKDHTTYNMNGYRLHVNNSTYDTVDYTDEDGNVLESWNLDY